MIKTETQLIQPYKNQLINLLEPSEASQDLKRYASELPTLQVSNRTLCDLELLATGAFSPLQTFMGSSDYKAVVNDMRLADGTLFPIPITLPTQHFEGLKLDHEIALRDARNEILAVLRVDEIFEWDYEDEIRNVYRTSDSRHPLVSEMTGWGPMFLSGKLRVLQTPHHYDFSRLRATPSQVRESLSKLGASKVVAFQTRNPMHRSHEELTKRVLELVDGTLLIHPTVGVTRTEDIDYYTRIRAIQSLVDHYFPQDRTLLRIVPLAMRLAGPREALWHMIIRRNFGASHFIIGRDHASPGKDTLGKPFFDPYEAQELAQKHEGELGIKPVVFNEMVYLADENRYEEVTKVKPDQKTLSISGTEIRENYLRKGKPLPEWYTRPEISRILLKSYPARYEQGFCIWFTGLPSAGKSTIAEILLTQLYEAGRRVTLLDGDVVRTHLSKGLGFSREDRDTNILRIGFVASEIVKQNGVVVCAAVSPYRSTRDQVRSLFPPDNFIEVFVNTPLEVCRTRDVKGMYARALAGELPGFTGVDDPYEEPVNPELVIDAVSNSASECSGRIIDLLRSADLIS